MPNPGDPFRTAGGQAVCPAGCSADAADAPPTETIGFLFLARFVLALPDDSVGWEVMVALLAAAAMTLGNLACLWQDDLRRLLGWSAVSQTGYGLMAIVAIGRSDLAVPALLFFPLAYVPANLAAFGVVVELRGRTAITDYAGLARSRPALAGALALSFLSFIGVPPLSGFVAKLLLFLVAIEVGYTWLALVAAVNTVISIFYYVRVLARASFGDLHAPVPVLGRTAAWAALASAGALVVTGITAEPLHGGRVRGGGTAHPLTRRGARGRPGLASIADVAHARWIPRPCKRER